MTDVLIAGKAYEARTPVRLIHRLWIAASWDGPDELFGDEYERRAAQRFVTYYRSDGRVLIEERPRGEGGACPSSPGSSPRPAYPRPGPGDWAELLALIGVGPAEVVEAGTHDLPVDHRDEAPWRPPRPQPPSDVAGLFAEGAVRPVAGGEKTARIEVVPAGDLRLPSGRKAPKLSVKARRLGSCPDPVGEFDTP